MCDVLGKARLNCVIIVGKKIRLIRAEQLEKDIKYRLGIRWYLGIIVHFVGYNNDIVLILKRKHVVCVFKLCLVSHLEISHVSKECPLGNHLLLVQPGSLSKDIGSYA